MKTLTALFLAAITASAALAADALPVFNATLTVGKESRFVLVGADGKASSWLKVGDSFDGYVVKNYDPKANTITVEKNGKTTDLALAADARVAAGAADAVTAATIEDATRVLNTMHFDELLTKVIERQKKMVSAQMDSGLKRAIEQGVSQEDANAFRDKILAELDAIIDPVQLKTDITRIYSEVFTKSELDGMAAFYSTPLGEAISTKQADVQEKLGPIMQQRMMQAMPRIQQLSQQFHAEQQAKKQAAAPAPAATPAPTAQPAPAPKP